MKYTGMELKEITTPQVFDPPKLMVVWDNSNYEPLLDTAYAIIRLENGTTEVIGSCCRRWMHCANIPEEPKPRRATNRELAKWLAQGYGEKHEDSSVYQGHAYSPGKANAEVRDVVKVRKWDDAEWHEPTVDYMDIEDKQVDAKPIARYDVTDKYGNRYSVRFTKNGLKVFPTPVSIEKSEEIISLARKQFPELENGYTSKG